MFADFISFAVLLGHYDMLLVMWWEQLEYFYCLGFLVLKLMEQSWPPM